MADDWRIEPHLDGAHPDVRELYERLVEIVEVVRSVRLLGVEDGHHLQGCSSRIRRPRPRRRYLAGYFDVTRKIDDPRIARVTPCTKRLFVHAWRVDRLDQMDDQFEGWIAEAYAVGNGAHLNDEV